MDRRNVDIVIVRMDKIGDLVLSMAVDEHPAFLGRRVHWIISQGLGFIAAQAVPQRQASEYHRRFSPFEMIRLVRWLKAQKPQTVVLLHNPWWVSMAAWLAGVPERMGRQSQWHSFLFVNLPIVQKRSSSDRHESDFNFDLVEWGFNRLGLRHTTGLSTIKKTYLRLVPPNPYATLAARGLKERGYRVVHPGMAGSALNWPIESFRALIERLAKDLPVVITGTRMDQKFLQGLESLRELPNVKWMVSDLKVMELLDILSGARSVTAPSTGVLHLAASLGTPTLGIYSPRKVEHPRRWGPKGLNVGFLLPAVQEAEMFSPTVMGQISVDDALQALCKLEDHGGPSRSQAHSVL